MTETSDPKNAEQLMDPDARGPDPSDEFLDPATNAADPKELRRRAISDKAREFAEEADLRYVLSSEQGQRFVARVIGVCGWNMPFFNPSNSWMCETAGRRSIAWQLEQWISNADLSLWFAVRRELEKQRVKPKTSERGGKR